MMIEPIHVSLQDPRVHFIGSIGVLSSPLICDWPLLILILIKVISIHEDIVMLRGNGSFFEVNDIRKLDATHSCKVRWKRMNVKFPCYTLVNIPLDFVGIRIYNK